VLLAGGTGNPYFTTDTGAALRAAELGCDAILKATQVDGVYDSDPMQNPNAKRFDKLTHDEALKRGLGVMDAAAFALAREAKLPIIVFSIRAPGAIAAAIKGEGKATIVTP
jgi:uridylate kinase